jgi:hypothetical protein
MFRPRIRPENHVPRSVQPKSTPGARPTDFRRIPFLKTVFHTPSTHLPRIPCSAQRPAYRRPGARPTDFRRKTFGNSVLPIYDVRPRTRPQYHVPRIAQPIIDPGHV